MASDDLIAALKPFAADAQNWADTVPDDYAPRCTEPGKEYAHPGSETPFTVGDIRRASALLARISRAPITDAVAVKPLAWEPNSPQTPNSLWVNVPAINRHYTIDPESNVFRVETQLSLSEYGPERLGLHPTIDAAKAAAQADFEQRIRSALVAHPLPQGEAGPARFVNCTCHDDVSRRLCLKKDRCSVTEAQSTRPLEASLTERDAALEELGKVIMACPMRPDMRVHPVSQGVRNLRTAFEAAESSLAAMQAKCCGCLTPAERDETINELSSSLAAEKQRNAELARENEDNRKGFEFHAGRAERERARAEAAEQRVVELTAERDEAKTAVERLNKLINSPETEDWIAGVPIEAAHQIERWGADHDAGKAALDWFWLIGHLAQKATTAAQAGDISKAKHHTISTAAVLLNWHRHLTGETTAMRPGIDPVERGIS